jgi:hypothetical protein
MVCLTGRTLETHLNKKQVGGWMPFPCFLKPNFGCIANAIPDMGAMTKLDLASNNIGGYAYTGEKGYVTYKFHATPGGKPANPWSWLITARTPSKTRSSRNRSYLMGPSRRGQNGAGSGPQSKNEDGGSPKPRDRRSILLEL